MQKEIGQSQYADMSGGPDQSGGPVFMRTDGPDSAAQCGHFRSVNDLASAAGAFPNARALPNAAAFFCTAAVGHASTVRRLLAIDGD